jgi:CDP-glucose 4,6-dehydratase
MNVTTLGGDTWRPTEGFWRHRNVAVTGGTGFLGSHLVGMLVDLGANVVVLVRDEVPPTPISERWQGRVSVVHGAVEDQPIVARLLGEYEVVTLFHLAAQTQVQVANDNPVSTFTANVAGTWSVLEAARHSPRTAQILVASSDKAYGGQPMLPYTEDMALLAVHPYDVSKACADLLATSYARTFNLPVAVTRCGNFFGPGDTNWERLVPGTIRSLVEGRRPIIRSDGTLTRDYLYIVDAARSYLQLAEALAEHPEVAGQAWNFSAERPISVVELVEMLQIATGTKLEPDIKGTANNEIEHQYLSAAKARQVLGWKPGHTLEEALIMTVRWYRDYLRQAEAPAAPPTPSEDSQPAAPVLEGRS